MSLQPYDPWERLLTIRRQMLDLFGELIAAPSSRLPASLLHAMRELEELAALPSIRPAFVPPVDIAVMRGRLLVRVPLPGVVESSLEIVVEGASLLVRGTTEELLPPHARVLLRECPYGSFERRIELPRAANPRALSAQLDDGVLEISVPIADV